MLGQVIKHDVLISLVGTKDMTGWFDGVTTQASQWSHHRLSINGLVAETTASLAGITNCLLLGIGLVGDQVVAALDYGQFGEKASCMAAPVCLRHCPQ